jgi:hypothetical protein
VAGEAGFGVKKVLFGVGLILGAGLLAILGRALLLGNEDAIFHFGSGCYVRRFTGFYCAGCGGTRAFFALLHGDFAKSWSMNPLVMLFGLLGLAVVVRGVVLAAFPGRFGWLRRLRFTVRMGWVFLGMLLAFAVARNFPWWPFTLLAPH